MATEIGLSCYLNGDRECRCGNQYGTMIKRGEGYVKATARMEREAGLLGWVIGIDVSGQAHFACPEHADCGLIDTFVLI